MATIGDCGQNTDPALRCKAQAEKIKREAEALEKQAAAKRQKADQLMKLSTSLSAGGTVISQ